MMTLATQKSAAGYCQRCLLQSTHRRGSSFLFSSCSSCRVDWELLPHPSYSPNLASSDFRLFGPLKKFTRGTKLESNNEVKSVVSNSQRHQSQMFSRFYTEGIRKLVHKWRKYITLRGNNIEKKLSFYLY